ncbi:transposase [Bradyrhizobium sp. 150]|nr:transposase [Bradyrhizobium sp. 150]
MCRSTGRCCLALGCWRLDYNRTRPHSQLGWRTPSEFAMTCHPRRPTGRSQRQGRTPREKLEVVERPLQQRQSDRTWSLFAPQRSDRS